MKPFVSRIQLVRAAGAALLFTFGAGGGGWAQTFPAAAVSRSAPDAPAAIQGGGNTIDAGPASGTITLASPTASVPVRITRASGSPAIMAFSITISVNEPQITLPAGRFSITLPAGDGYLNADGGRTVTLQTVDLGGGSYQADGTTLGPPCGSTALTGTLFEVEVTSAALAGTGTVTITAVTLRDCGNVTVPSAIGTVGTVLVDRSAPLVTVTAPNGGETWFVGTTETITWTGSDPEGVATYALAYSTDGGATYPNPIATVPGTQTSYLWTIPAAPGTMVRVRASALDVNGNDAADASDANFTIALPAGNSALEFDGTSQYVSFGAAPALGVAQFTIELWFKKTGAGSTTSSGSGGVVAVPLLAKGRGEADGDARDVNYFLGIDAAGHLVADYEEGAGQISPGLNHPVTGSTVVANGVWYHAAAVYDGTSLRLYLNGQVEGTVPGLAGRNPQSASSQHATLATTRNSLGVLEGYFAGVIDEPRIWSVPHNQCQVIASMNLEVTSGAGLAGRWGLNEGVGSTAGNSVAGSPDGTLENGPPWKPGAPFDLTPPVVPVPAAPSDLLASAPDALQAMLSWTDHASSESGFEIERSTSGSGGPFSPLATVGPDVTAYVDAVLDPETEYCYRVRATGCAGASDFTTAACATTTAGLCRALAFTPAGAGTNAYVRLGNPAALRLSQFTLELWLQRNGPGIGTPTASGGITDAVPLITKGRSQDDADANNVNYFLAIRQSDGVLAADFEEGPSGPNPGTSHPVTGVTPVVTGMWQHVAATYDGSTWKLYLNGNLDAQLAVNRPAASGSMVSVALAGALNGLDAPSGYLDGAIDEVRIWNYARTQADIQSTMFSELGSPTAGLVGRWGLDEGAGSIVYGTAATGIHGPIVGSAITDWSRTGCVFDLVSVDPDRVSEVELRPVIPNPVRGAASFQFAIPRASRVTLEILDVQGRRVGVLADGERGPGRHEVPWSGRVASGIYFLRLSGPGHAITRRFVVLNR